MHLRCILQLAATAVLVSGDASVATALEPAQATDVSTRRLLRDDGGEERAVFKNFFKSRPVRVDNPSVEVKSAGFAENVAEGQRLDEWLKKLRMTESGEEIFVNREFRKLRKSYSHENVSELKILRQNGFTEETLAKAVKFALESRKKADVHLGIKMGKSLRKSWGHPPAAKLEPYRVDLCKKLEEMDTRITRKVAADKSILAEGGTLDEGFKQFKPDISKSSIFKHKSFKTWANLFAQVNTKLGSQISPLGYLRTKGFTDEELAQAVMVAMKSDDMGIVQTGINYGTTLQENWAYLPYAKLHPYQLRLNNELEVLKTRFLVLDDTKKVGQERLDTLFKRLGLDELKTTELLVQKNLKTWIDRMHEFKEKNDVDITLFKFLRTQGYDDEFLADAAITALKSEDSDVKDVGLELGKALQASWGKHELEPYQINFNNELDVLGTRFLVLDDKKKVGKETLDELFQSLKQELEGSVLAVLMNKDKLSSWINHMREFNEKNGADITLFKFLKAQDYTDKAIADAAIVALISKDPYATDLGLELGKALQASWGTHELNRFQIIFNNKLDVLGTRALMLDDTKKVGEERLDELFKRLRLDKRGRYVLLNKKNLKTWIDRMHEFNEKNDVDITLLKVLRTHEYDDELLANAAIRAITSRDSYVKDVGLELGKALQASWGKHELKPNQIILNEVLDVLETRFLLRDDKMDVGRLDKLFKKLKLDKLGTNALFVHKNLKTWIDHMHEFNEKNEVDITLFKFLKAQGYTDTAVTDAAIAAMRSKNLYAIDVGYKVGIEVRKALQASWGKHELDRDLNELLKKVAAAMGTA